MKISTKWLVSDDFEAADVEGQSGIFIGCNDTELMREWVELLQNSDNPALLVEAIKAAQNDD